MDKVLKWIWAFVVAAGLMSLFNRLTGNMTIYSDKKIEPALDITYRKGKLDTTFIYKNE